MVMAALHAHCLRAGRDPKPWPPPFELSRKMVEAMGGAGSEADRRFCAHACEAYNILCKSASLILSLFHLMAGATIPDTRSDPEKAMLKLRVCAPYTYAAIMLVALHEQQLAWTGCKARPPVQVDLLMPYLRNQS